MNKKENRDRERERLERTQLTKRRKVIVLLKEMDKEESASCYVPYERSRTVRESEEYTQQQQQAQKNRIQKL